MSAPHVATPNYEERIRLADAGDKLALRDLYGHASAWARAGKPIPEPLGTWIADRLLDVARAIDARKDSDIGRTAGMARGGSREMATAVAVGMGVQRAGKQGRAPSARTAKRQRALALDVLHFMTWENLLPYPACERAAEYNLTTLAGRIPGASQKAYEAAWAAHGEDLMRERGIEFADPKKRPK